MDNTETYESFPIRIVVFSNLVSLLIYFTGFMIMLKSGWIAAGIYLVFILAFEYRLLRRHCVNCYYWNRTCGFGKGRISALFFKRGDPGKFCEKEMSWRDMIPDLLISLIPVIAGIVLMILKFDPRLLAAVIVLILLSTYGNGFIRGSLVCRYCRQRELGCPAEKLFSKGKKLNAL